MHLAHGCSREPSGRPAGPRASGRRSPRQALDGECVTRARACRRPAVHGQRGALPALHSPLGQEGRVPAQQGGHPGRRRRGGRGAPTPAPRGPGARRAHALDPGLGGRKNLQRSPACETPRTPVRCPDTADLRAQHRRRCSVLCSPAEGSAVPQARAPQVQRSAAGALSRREDRLDERAHVTPAAYADVCVKSHGANTGSELYPTMGLRPCR